MPRNAGSPPTDAKQQLTNAIALTKGKLRRMELRLRAKQDKDLHAQYVRVGKVVKEMGLLEEDSEVIEAVLRAGMEMLDIVGERTTDNPRVKDTENIEI